MKLFRVNVRIYFAAFAPIAELTLKYTFLIATTYLVHPTTADLITIVQCVKEMSN